MICHMCSFLMVLYPIYKDVREQKINLIPAVLLLMSGTMVLVFTGKGDAMTWLKGMVPGMFIYLIGRLFGDCIGSGDAVLIICVGALEGMAFCLRLLMISGFSIFVFSAIMMARGKLHRKSQVACVPFLTIGYVGACFI